MKIFYPVVLLIALLFIGCNSGTSPVVPNHVPTFSEYNAYFTTHLSDYPTTYVVDGRIASLDEFILKRSAQGYVKMPPGWIPNGSLMTDAELEIYFPAHIVESMLKSMQHPYFCPIYTSMHDFFVFQDSQYPPGFTYVRFCVWYMEMQGYDVPDQRDIFPNC